MPEKRAKKVLPRMHLRRKSFIARLVFARLLYLPSPFDRHSPPEMSRKSLTTDNFKWLQYLKTRALEFVYSLPRSNGATGKSVASVLHNLPVGAPMTLQGSSI